MAYSGMPTEIKDLISEYTGRAFRLQKNFLRIYLQNNEKSRYLDFKAKPGVWLAEWAPWTYMPPGEFQDLSYRALILRSNTLSMLPLSTNINVHKSIILSTIDNILICSDKPLLNIINFSRKMHLPPIITLHTIYASEEAIILVLQRDTSSIGGDEAGIVVNVQRILEHDLAKESVDILRNLDIKEAFDWCEGYVHLNLNGKTELPKLFTSEEIKRFVSPDLSVKQLRGVVRVDFAGDNKVIVRAAGDDNDPEGVEENPIHFPSFHYPTTQKLSDYMGSIGPENFNPAYSVAKTPKYLNIYYDQLRELDAEWSITSKSFKTLEESTNNSSYLR